MKFEVRTNCAKSGYWQFVTGSTNPTKAQFIVCVQRQDITRSLIVFNKDRSLHGALSSEPGQEEVYVKLDTDYRGSRDSWLNTMLSTRRIPQSGRDTG